MNPEVYLYLTAATIGTLHTLLGPDHYLPFIFMSQAGKWSRAKTFWITILCGIGHIGSSVILGIIGIAFGIALRKLVFIESVRGNIAAWLFIAFGFVYMIYGIKKAVRNQKHSHVHLHSDGDAHVHTHNHYEEHSHVHSTTKNKSLTPWILFTIFVFGPCEPLIPLLMFPAAQNSHIALVMVCIIFGLTTIITMTTIVMVSLWGIRLFDFGKLERYTTAIAGATILICGLAIQFLGL
jgi:nickel/cobalt transporter (NicO) family protein